MSALGLVFLFSCTGSPSPEGPEVSERPPAPPPTAAHPTLQTPVASSAPAAAVWPEVLPVVPERLTQSALTEPADARVKHVRELLLGAVTSHALDPKNPWGVAHAMVAMGPKVTLSDGRDGVDALYADFGGLLEVGEHQGVRFPRKVGNSRVEPHTDLLLKAFVETGVDPSREVLVQGETVTVADHWRASLLRAWVDGDDTSFDSFNDSAWALRGIAGWAPPNLVWTSADGHEMSLDAFTLRVVQEEYALNAELRASITSGATVQKRGQGIWTHTCGGAHTLQAGAYAVARGFGGEEARKMVVADVPVFLHRLDLELQQVDHAMTVRPDYGVILIEQRLKFLGHFLETAHTYSALGLLPDTPENRAVLNKARLELVATVEGLERAGLFPRLGELRAAQEQVFLDYVGDAAHAIHGLDLSTGDASVRW